MTSEGGSSGASPRDSASPPTVRDGASLPTTASFQVTIHVQPPRGMGSADSRDSEWPQD